MAPVCGGDNPVSVKYLLLSTFLFVQLQSYHLFLPRVGHRTKLVLLLESKDSRDDVSVPLIQLMSDELKAVLRSLTSHLY